MTYVSCLVLLKSGFVNIRTTEYFLSLAMFPTTKASLNGDETNGSSQYSLQVPL